MLCCFLLSTTSEMSGTAEQSSTKEDYTADKAIDGVRTPTISSGYCAVTQKLLNSWWMMDMGACKTIHDVSIFSMASDYHHSTYNNSNPIIVR